MDTIITIRKRLAQGYTHVYYENEAGANFEKQILDESRCAKSYEEAQENICSEHGMSVEEWDSVQYRFSPFIWDLKEELDDLTSVCTRDREAGNIIEFFSTVREAERAMWAYELEDRNEGTYTPEFYEIAVRKEGVYVSLDK